MPARPYQSKFIKDIFDAFRSKIERDGIEVLVRAVLGVMPTAAGKGYCFLEIAREASARGLRVEIVVHLKDLVKQLSRALTLAGIEHGVIRPGRAQTDHLVQVSTIQTRVNRIKTTPAPDLMIFDEAHHSVSRSFRTLLASLPLTTRILGVTATPERLDGVGLGIENGGIYDVMILGPDNVELTDANYLAFPIVYYPDHGTADMEGCDVKFGDYVKKQASERVNKPVITGCAVAHYIEKGRGLGAVAFTVDVTHAYEVAESFNKQDIPAAVLEGKMTEAERDRVLEGYDQGNIKVLVSCNLISEGFDIPGANAVGVVILLRPTDSVQVHDQQMGRALRNPFWPERREVIILDHVGNVLKPHLGSPLRARSWSLWGTKDVKKKKELGITPQRVRRCLECFACWPASYTECPCGYVFKSVRDGFQYMEGELKRLDELEQKAQEKIAAEELKAQKKREQALCRTFNELLAFAIKWNHDNPEKWAHAVFDGRIDREKKRIRVCGMPPADFASSLGRALFTAAEKPRRGTTQQLLEQIMFEVYQSDVAQAEAWLNGNAALLAEHGVELTSAGEGVWKVRRLEIGGSTHRPDETSSGEVRWTA